MVSLSGSTDHTMIRILAKHFVDTAKIEAFYVMRTYLGRDYCPRFFHSWKAVQFIPEKSEMCIVCGMTRNS